MCEKEIFAKAIERFGNETNINKAIEEMSELITALIKESDIDNIHEEIADVQITLTKLKMIFDKKEIDKFYKIKLKRLRNMVS